jgi:MFS family permease
MTLRPASYRVTFAVLSGGVATFALLQSLVTPVLSTVQVQLHTTQSTVTWVLTAYLLSASVSTPIMGRIGDMYGKERVFVVALAALALGSLLGALADSITPLIIARVIQGVGGGVLPLAFGIIRDEFPLEKVAGAIGSLASLTAVGGGLGAVLAGPIVSVLSYRWLFWFPLIMTGVAAAAAVRFVPASPVRSPGSISWRPAVPLAGMLLSFLVALSEAPEWGWGSTRVIGLFAVAAGCGAGWVRAERRATTALIDLRMMRARAVWTNNLVSFLLGVSVYAMFAFLPEFVQTPTSTGYGFGASISRSGLILLPSSITMFVVAQVTDRIARRLGGSITVAVGCLVSAAAMVVFTFAHGVIWELLVANIIQGGGFGLAFAAMSGLVVAAVPAEQTGVASGMNTNIRTIGGSVGTALMASIVTAHLGADRLPRESGYTLGFGVLAGGLLMAALAAVLIPSPRPPREPGPAPERSGHATAPTVGPLLGDPITS